MRGTGFLLSCLCLALAVPAAGRSNLRRPGGRKSADYDGKSFLIGERRVLLLSGGVHYFRIPPSEWRHRLVQTRLAGFNTIETPIPWNLHQPTKDTFDTQGAADLGRFLDLCHELRLMAIVRVGPYVNAALSNGGLPAWLGDEARLHIRASDPHFLEAVRAWWGKLLPIVVRRQVPDGPVVLIQVEDNHKDAGGGYLSKLYDELALAGCRVPIVLSDLNPCKSFQRVDIPDKAVYATTELMPVPPLAWGQSNRPFRHLDDVVLEGLAKGIDGYNLAMWATGTNFALLQASSFPTRFESNTCGINETGSLTPIHTELKRVNLFAQTFERVLTASHKVTSHWLLDAARSDGLVAYARTDGTTTLVFLKRRHGSRPFEFTDKASGARVTLVVGDAVAGHLVIDHPLTPETRVSLSAAQVISIQKLPDRVLVLASAQPDAAAFINFATPAKPRPIKGAKDMAWDAKSKVLAIRWNQPRGRGVVDYVFQADQRIHVVVVAEEELDETWVLDGAGILLGAPGVGQWTPSSVEVLVPSKRGKYTMAFYPAGSQRSVGKAGGISGASFDEEARRLNFTLDYDAPRPTTILLRRWEMAELGNEVEPGFDHSSWAASPRPVPLGEAPYGWYRATIKSDRQRTRKLIFKNAADAITVFLNGKYLGQSATKRLMDAPRSFPMPLSFDAPIQKGDNVLAVLAKSWGRYRLTETYGKPLAEASGWGLLADVTLDGALVTKWHRRDGMSPTGRSLSWVKPSKGGCPVRWYRTTFKLRKSPARPVGRAVLKGLRHGAIWLNGRFVGLYLQRGFDAGHGYYLPPAWLKPQNTLIALEEGGYEPAEAELRFDRKASLVPLSVTFR